MYIYIHIYVEMARRGRTNPSLEQRPVILALECPSVEESSSSRRPSQPRARNPAHIYASFANHFSPFIVTIHAGEDIGEMIRAFFEELKHNIQSSSEGLSVEGRIFGVSGDVSNPRIDVQGSAIIFEGTYSIATLSGRYVIRNDGPVQQDCLKLSFQPDDEVVGGSVVGPLIAGCAVQATLGYVRLDG
ncbi:hypothetical protein Pfo_026879 [Paulownia fortunei]|nr:hypothetical protein Pfo_026879 [Paulownia fortunei]